MNCRYCKSFLKHTFLDLGFAPPSNTYLSKENLNHPEQSGQTYFSFEEDKDSISSLRI
jgi:hypothetical protein